MLQLYIVTGCDYTSYTAGIGKVTFLKCFFQHAEFITGTQTIGCLSQTEPSNMNSGFFALVRLVGTVYFKRNLATVVSKLGFETPDQLFNSINQSLSDEEKHKEWYISIKRVIRVYSEEQRPPTLTALKRHWMRSCWVQKMWENSSKPDQYDGLPPPESHGWLKDNNVDWEGEDVRKRIQATLNFLDKGCSCKTGCKTKRCGCQKNGRSCGAGCECRDCTNVELSQAAITQTSEDDEVEEESDSEGEDCIDEEERSEDIETEIVTDFDDTTINDFNLI